MRKVLSFLLAAVLLCTSAPYLPVSAENTGHVIINQVYGRAAQTSPESDTCAISHSFIELYNPTTNTADLSSYSLQYCQSGNSWIKLDLTGVSIPAHTSYLVRCYSADGLTGRYTVTNFDKEWNEAKINNKAFKIALVNNQVLLSVTAPAVSDGVVDFLGAGETDAAEGTAIAGISKQKSARRKSFVDTDDNNADFEIIDYRTSGINDTKLTEVYPRYSGNGIWGVQEDFPVSITGLTVKNNIVSGMQVNVSAVCSENVRGIVAVYDSNDKLLRTVYSDNIRAKETENGVYEFTFKNGVSISKNEICRAFVWGINDAAELTLVPYAQSYILSDGVIHLNGNSINAPGVDNITVSGSTATISAAGTYELEGTLFDGQIMIKTPGNKDEVNLILNGVNIESSTSGPFFGANGKINIILNSGSQNVFTDAAAYVYAAGADEPNACLFSKRDLTISGSGALTVNGNYNNGIGCKSDLEIKDGNITVNAANNALKGNNSITVTGGTLNVKANDDGIKSDSTDGEGYGVATISKGNITIDAGGDGIQATTEIRISDGTTTITSNEDAINCTAGSVTIANGKLSIISQQDAVQAETSLNILGGVIDAKAGGGYTGTATALSTKGMKGLESINISGGTLSVNTRDDAIHSNGVVNITGGNMTLSSGDDAIHADKTVNIQNEPIIDIKTSYEGIEALTINIAGGTTHLVATDDGVNASGGADQSNTTGPGNPGGRPGQGIPNQGSGNGLIHITGGYIAVDSTGDGLDANGKIEMSGGTVIINGPTSNGDAPIDYDDTFIMSGGLLIAAGSSGMAQAPSSTSAQRAVKITYKSSQAKNTLATIKNASGNNVISFAPSKQYASLVVCSPNIAANQTYSIYSGGSCSGTVADGLYIGGTLSGGSQKGSFTSSSVITETSVN